MRRFILTLLAILVCHTTAGAQAASRRPITHEDVFLAKRIGAPALSPDGRLAVFSVTEPSYTESEQTSDLWVVTMDGSSPPRRLTHTRGGEGGVAWSPDSRRIAFTARRDGDDATQVYVLDIAGGGEAQRVTRLVNGASTPVWRPDGGALLFSSMIYPGAATDSANRAAAAERRARRYNARVYESSPIRMWDRWLDDRRPSLFVQTLEPGAPARDLLAGTQLAANPDFGGQLGNAGESLSAAWTRDGSGVVFVATANRRAWAWADLVQSLWLVSATGGEPRRLTTDSSDYGAPRFSPDGRVLYATMNPATQWTYNSTRLVAFPWNGSALGAPRVVAGGADRSVDGWRLAPDGRTLYFLSQDQGRVRLFRVPAAGAAGAAGVPGAAQEVGALREGTYVSMDVGGAGAAPAIVVAWESAVHPPEVGRVDASTGRFTRLTQFNTQRAAQIDWQPLREFWFTSSRGKRIRSFVALPPAFDSTKKYPLFVLMHGGPHTMWIDQFVLRWNYHLLAAPGYVMLMTDYSGSTGYGERFAQEIQFDPLRGPASEINEAADEAIRRYPFIDGTRQVAGGASYGGHLANWLAVTTTRYRALVSHAGLWDLETQWATSDFNYGRERNVGSPPWQGDSLWRVQSPMRHAANLRTPVLLTIGEQDFRVPVNNTLEFWTALQRQRVPGKLIVFPTENHWILNGENSRFFYREVHDWIARWLK